MKADRGLTVERMLELGRVRRSLRSLHKCDLGHRPLPVVFEWRADLLNHKARLAERPAIFADLKDLSVRCWDENIPPFDSHFFSPLNL